MVHKNSKKKNRKQNKTAQYRGTVRRTTTTNVVEAEGEAINNIKENTFCTGTYSMLQGQHLSKISFKF